MTRLQNIAAMTAVVGALLGVGLVWITKERALLPGSVVLDNGLRSPMPVIVVGPPLWAYVLAGTLGALLGAVAVLSARHLWRLAESTTT